MYGRRREKSPSWKGGRKIRKDGYVVVRVDDDYPFPSDTTRSGGKYALEHRVVMEKHLGRYLSRSEVIHHINENPSDNRIENLRLYATQSDHVADAHPTPTKEERRNKKRCAT
jgi:hypothetical protein